MKVKDHKTSKMMKYSNLRIKNKSKIEILQSNHNNDFMLTLPVLNEENGPELSTGASPSIVHVRSTQEQSCVYTNPRYDYRRAKNFYNFKNPGLLDLRGEKRFQTKSPSFTNFVSMTKFDKK